MPKSFFTSLLAAATMVAIASTAAAQMPPPSYVPPPPPGYGPAPPGYAPPLPGYPPPGYPPPGYPPPGYPPPYGYGSPPYPQYAAPPPPVQPRASMDPDNPPNGYHTESRSRSGMVVGGTVMLSVSYVFSAAAGAAGVTDKNRGLEPLFIPVVGPFITLNTADVFGSTKSDAVEVGKVFGAIGLILDGVVQIGGLTLVVVGLAARKQVVVRDRNENSRAVPDFFLGPRGGSARWSF